MCSGWFRWRFAISTEELVSVAQYCDSYLLCHSDRSRMIRDANHSAEWRNLLFFREKAGFSTAQIVRCPNNHAPLEMTGSGVSQHYAKLARPARRRVSPPKSDRQFWRNRGTSLDLCPWSDKRSEFHAMPFVRACRS